MVGGDSFSEWLFQAIGKKVSQCRAGHQPPMSQARLAAKAGISRAAVSALESGQQGVSVPTLCLLATALNVAPSDLLPGRDELSRLSEEPSAKPAEQLVEEYLSRHE